MKKQAPGQTTRIANHLDYWIKQSGYKKYEVAEATLIPMRTLNDYCKGRTPIPRSRLATLAAFLECPISALLGDAEAKKPKPVSFYPASPETNGQPASAYEMSTANTTSDADPSSLTHAQEASKEIDRSLTRKLTRLQNWVVDILDEETRLRWYLYHTSSNSLTEDGLLSQITRLEQLADSGGEHYRHICRTLAQNYQLAGSLARDRFQYTKSIENFQKAVQLHDDVRLPDLTATAIARQAVVLLRKDQERYLSKALVLYNSAIDKAKRAEPYTRAYILSGYAEALAREGNYDQCIESLDRAETLLNSAANVPIEEDFAYVHLTLQSLADSRGECYVLLGNPGKGLEYLEAAQKKLDQKMSRNTCRLLMQQAEAYLAAGQPDACVQYALKGLAIARMLESTSNTHWASEILAKLRSSPFSKEPAVDELQEALRS